MPDYHQRWDHLSEFSPIGIALVSPEGRWISVNPSLCKMLGYTPAELMAATFQDITHADDLEIDLELVLQMLKGERSHYFLKKRYLSKTGNIIHVKLGVSGVYDDQNKLLYFISQIVDLTPEYDAFSIDVLTHLYNRRRILEEELPRLISLCKGHLSILVIDVNKFKHINDTYGHQAGDEALIEIARRMLSASRRDDTVGRIGGDEFLILLPNTEANKINRIVNRLKARVDRPFSFKGISISLSCSVGWATMADGWTQDQLMDAADASMYANKRSARSLESAPLNLK